MQWKDKTVDVLIIIVYWVAGYWAYGVVFYEGKIVIHKVGELFMKKFWGGLLLGWALIPVACLKRLFGGKR